MKFVMRFLLDIGSVLCIKCRKTDFLFLKKRIIKVVIASFTCSPVVYIELRRLVSSETFTFSLDQLLLT